MSSAPRYYGAISHHSRQLQAHTSKQRVHLWALVIHNAHIWVRGAQKQTIACLQGVHDSAKMHLKLDSSAHSESEANLRKTTMNHNLHPTVWNVHLHGARKVQHYGGELLQRGSFCELIQLFKHAVYVLKCMVNLFRFVYSLLWPQRLHIIFNSQQMHDGLINI